MVNNVTAHIVIDSREEPNRKDYLIHANELQDQIISIQSVIATADHYKLAGALAFNKNKNGKIQNISEDKLSALT